MHNTRYLGEVPEGSGADAEVRFPQDSDAEVRSGSGGLRCTYPGQVLEGFRYRG